MNYTWYIEQVYCRIQNLGLNENKKKMEHPFHSPHPTPSILGLDPACIYVYSRRCLEGTVEGTCTCTTCTYTHIYGYMKKYTYCRTVENIIWIMDLLNLKFDVYTITHALK